MKHQLQSRKLFKKLFATTFGGSFPIGFEKRVARKNYMLTNGGLTMLQVKEMDNLTLDATFCFSWHYQGREVQTRMAIAMQELFDDSEASAWLYTCSTEAMDGVIRRSPDVDRGEPSVSSAESFDVSSHREKFPEKEDRFNFFLPVLVTPKDWGNGEKPEPFESGDWQGTTFSVDEVHPKSREIALGQLKLAIKKNLGGYIKLLLLTEPSYSSLYNDLKSLMEETDETVDTALEAAFNALNVADRREYLKRAVSKLLPSSTREDADELVSGLVELQRHVAKHDGDS